MSGISPSLLEEAVRSYQDPYLSEDLISLDAVKQLEADANGQVTLHIRMPYPCNELVGAMKSIIGNALSDVEGVTGVDVTVDFRIDAHKAQGNLQSMASVRNIIAVASGKGGVGKSTTSVNLALALAQEGARVGILDADIYGPSVGMMLGIPEGTRPDTFEQKYFIPISAHGIEVMSMAFLLTDKTPVVWRGPMVSGALLQLLTQTRWPDLDYLIVDMPPGTGDIQLTLAQKVPVTGAVVVTTPQDIALLDGKKGIEMFRKVDIPVLGVLENMSVHICSNCGHQEPLFGAGGGERIAEQYDVDLLGQLPLHMTIREQMDNGVPSVVAESDSEVARRYRDIARRMAASLSQRERHLSSPIPSVSISDD